MNEHNPYAAPVNVETAANDLPFDIGAADRKKVDAIIKDAGQFWLAIILCIICTGIASIIVPFWYLVRLVQWNGLAKKYPGLVVHGPPPASLQAKFKSSQWKLIVGMVVGGIVFLGLVAYFTVIGLVAYGAP